MDSGAVLSGNIEPSMKPDDLASANEVGKLSGTFRDGKKRRIGSPAIHARLSRSRGSVRQDPVQRQEAQIVQPRKTLDDSLP